MAVIPALLAVVMTTELIESTAMGPCGNWSMIMQAARRSRMSNPRSIRCKRRLIEPAGAYNTRKGKSKTTPIMTREQIRIGVLPRATKDHWDATARTLAEGDTVRQSSRFVEWYFIDRVASTPPTKRTLHVTAVLILLEIDLADFEIFTGPLPEINSPPRR
jgi:hypothetical protein